MSIQRPIVIKNGQLQQLQPGDVLSGPTVNDNLLSQTYNLATEGTNAAIAAYNLASAAYTLAVAGTNTSGTNASTNYEILNLFNSDGTAHTLGEIVYVTSAGNAQRAKADSNSTANAIAFATGSIAPDHFGDYQMEGRIDNLTSPSVDNQIGGALEPGKTYFLSSVTAGTMTSTAPSALGELVVNLGKAFSTTKFAINIQPSIQL